jgi:hypothetical protein
MNGSRVGRRGQGDKANRHHGEREDGVDTIENRDIALSWLANFRRSEHFDTIPAETRDELAFAARVLALCCDHVVSRSLRLLTAEDVRDLLLHRLPAKVSARHPRSVVDAAIELLLWAVRAGHVTREVEYTCRRVRHEAYEAMLDEKH